MILACVEPGCLLRPAQERVIIDAAVVQSEIFLVVGQSRAPGNIEVVREIKCQVAEGRQFLVPVSDGRSREGAERSWKLRVGRGVAGDDVGGKRIDPLVGVETADEEFDRTKPRSRRNGVPQSSSSGGSALYGVARVRRIVVAEQSGAGRKDT